MKGLHIVKTPPPKKNPLRNTKRDVSDPIEVPCFPDLDQRVVVKCPSDWSLIFPNSQLSFGV